MPSLPSIPEPGRLRVVLPYCIVIIPNDSPKKIRKVSLFHRHLSHLSWIPGLQTRLPEIQRNSWQGRSRRKSEGKAGDYRYLTVAQAEMNIHSPPFTTLLFGKVIDPQKNNAMPRFRRAKSALREIVSCRKNETQSLKPLTVIQNWGTPIKPFAYVHDMSPWFLCCSIPYIHHGDSGGVFNNDRGKGHFPN